jgi:PAS domain S-box-containing protein
VASDEQNIVGAEQGTELANAYLDLKQQYDELVRKNLAGVFRTTLQGRFVECNDSLAQILGYTDRQALMSVHVDELYMQPTDRQRFLHDLRERGQLTNYEAVLRHRNGRTVHVLENVSMHGSVDRPTTIVGTLIDITSFRQAELEQRSLLNSYRHLIDRVRDGILVVGQDRVLYANPAAEAIATHERWLGNPFLERIHRDDREEVEKALHASLDGSASGIIDARVGNGQDNWRDMLFSAAGLLHEGQPAVQVTLQDIGMHRSLIHERSRARIAEEVNAILRQEIMEHRRTQEALKASRRFARSLVDSSLDAIIAVDQQGLITEFNPAAAIKFGYEPDEALGKRTTMLYASEAEFKRIQQEMNMHGAFAGEVQNVTRDGRAFTSFLTSSRLYDEDGRLLGAMGVSRDITQARRDQEALRRSEELYRDLFENATDLIQSLDTEGRFLYVNNAWKKALGYKEDELPNMNILEVVHPEDRASFASIRQRLLAGEDVGPYSARFITKDGRTILVRGSSTVRTESGTPVATRGIFRDITDENNALEQVAEHLAKQRALFESSDHMFWTVDRRVALTSFNRGYAEMIERLYGTRPELNKDLNQPRKRFASEAYHAFWEGKYAEAFSGKAIRFETDLRDKDGHRVCNEIFLSPVFGSDGTVEEVFGIGHEITEQKNAEDLVREQAARLKAIFENSANMMIWTLDRDLRITSFNEHFRESNQRELGVHINVGDDLIDLLKERFADKRPATIMAKLRAAINGEPQQFESELRGTDRNIWTENFLNPIMVDGKVTEISCLAYGITDKKEAEAKLLDNLHEKEVLLKEVHHRVKNNLQIISSIFNLQKQYVDEHPRTLELLRDSQDRIRSMSFIHESLYQTKNFSHVDLATYIDGLSRNLMMSYSLSGKIELIKDLQPVELVLDQAIPCGLILNELISNALKHAFPAQESGSISITLKSDGPKVRITVTDSGPGLPPGFDVDRDANLGLQLVYTLIDQLDGHITPLPSQGPNGSGAGYLLTFDRTGFGKQL